VNNVPIHCHPVARIDIAYLCIKFDDYRFSHSSDMIGAPKIFNGSNDLTTPLMAVAWLRHQLSSMPNSAGVATETAYELLNVRLSRKNELCPYVIVSIHGKKGNGKKGNGNLGHGKNGNGKMGNR